MKLVKIIISTLDPPMFAPRELPLRIMIDMLYFIVVDGRNPGSAKHDDCGIGEKLLNPTLMQIMELPKIAVDHPLWL
jgi:hypothetical protein